MAEYQDKVYLNLIQQANTKYADLIKDDLGSQFIQSCGRDLAGELVRTYFDTSDFHITVDQLAMRMLKFSYGNEYDPIAVNGDIQKLSYNYHDNEHTKAGKELIQQMDVKQESLFTKEQYVEETTSKTKTRYKDHTMINEAKGKYADAQKNAEGSITDEYTHLEGEYIIGKDGRKFRRQEVEHTQALSSAKYNKEYISEEGIQRLREFYNSSENFAMMDKSANASKGDVRVYVTDKNGDKIDITHRATPEQYASAIIERWEDDNNSNKVQQLKDKGYLNEEGKVPKSVKNQLVRNIKASQNAESKVILKEAKYKKVATDAGKKALKSMGKVIAGQVIYYIMPPLMYEIKELLKNKADTLEEALERLSKATKRIAKYAYSKLSESLKFIGTAFMKNFIKSFLDLLINMVKATVKKLLAMAKKLVLSTVDAIKIICDKNTSRSEKADAVTNLFGVTITTIVLELVFEYFEKQLGIPEYLLLPLQTITTVICTNLTMLILQKADLFNVRHGFKINAIRQLFAETEDQYLSLVQSADLKVTENINRIIVQCQQECADIYNNLVRNNPYESSVLIDLEKINKIFRMNISFADEWFRFLRLNNIRKELIGN
ncbi:hypothetical protein PAECIP111802_07113 [Paenibacillus allorhizosphaerae]|uniref:Uncharacterized protein n=2 Tax=Paenibacillus allorhizosphaerae TaxID=2849866 RepID=A0ABN7U122_9BACL|nr:hypothetical protein PAECIP111802_07113 [Paenibacillus allorhizosphaerae]